MIYQVGTWRDGYAGALQQNAADEPSMLMHSPSPAQPSGHDERQADDPRDPVNRTGTPTLAARQPPVVTPTGLGWLALFALCGLLVAAKRVEKTTCY